MTYLNRDFRPEKQTLQVGIKGANMEMLDRLKKNIEAAEQLYYRAIFQEVVRPVCVRYGWGIAMVFGKGACIINDKREYVINRTVARVIDTCEKLMLRPGGDPLDVIMSHIEMNAKFKTPLHDNPAWSPEVYKRQQVASNKPTTGDNNAS